MNEMVQLLLHWWFSLTEQRVQGWEWLLVKLRRRRRVFGTYYYLWNGALPPTVPVNVFGSNPMKAETIALNFCFVFVFFCEIICLYLVASANCLLLLQFACVFELLLEWVKVGIERLELYSATHVGSGKLSIVANPGVSGWICRSISQPDSVVCGTHLN